MATMILVVAIVLLIGTFMVRSWAFEAPITAATPTTR
jgi:hypothetical protein